MHLKRFFGRLTLVTIGVICLLFLGLRLWSPPTSRTDEAAPIFPFYSPIHPTGDPDFELSKTVSDENPDPGDVIEYTLTYANSVPGSVAYNVRLYDFLPAGLAFLGANRPWATYEGGVLRFDMPNAGPSTDPVQVTIQARVLRGFEFLQNHAMVMGDGVIPETTSLLTDVTPTWLPLELTGYTVVLTKTELVYELTTENPSTMGIVKGIQLVNVLPTGLPLNDASVSPDEVTEPLAKWSRESLAANSSWTVVMTSTSPSSPGVITDTALVDARQHVLTQTTFATLVITRGGILRVDKRGSAPEVYVGDQLVYTLRYENAGNEVATDVTLTDTFPDDISVTAVSTPAQTLTDQQGVWALGTLSPGVQGKVVVTVTVEGEGGRTLLNKVDIAGQPGSLWPVYPGYDELKTYVRPFMLYLPVVSRNY